jgi:tetratricopeptide (TPR) repeat protein
MPFWDLLRRFLGPSAAGPPAAGPAAAGRQGAMPYSVLLGRLDGDADGSLGEAIGEALGKVAGVTVRAAPSPGAVTVDDEGASRAPAVVRKARAQARQAEAQCLLWGAVTAREVRLWVVPAALSPEPAGCSAMAGDGVVLPRPLETSLPLAVTLALTALPLDTDAQRAQRVEMLRGPAGAVDRLLQGGLPESAKPAAALCYAAALAEIGWRAGQRPLLDKAIDLHQAVLAKARTEVPAADMAAEASPSVPSAAPAAPPALAPMQQAAAQARLGDLLADVGRQDQDGDTLQRAVAWYRRAIRAYPANILPEEHARIAAQTARACHRLGHLTGQSAWMRDAVTAYRDASRIWTRATQPDLWAEMQTGIGTLLTQLGEFSGRRDLFERAVAVLSAVAEVWTRDDHPRRWAALHNNMGACCFAEGKIKAEIPPLRAALEHFAKALEVYERLGMTRNVHVTQKNIARVERLITVQEGR